MLHVRTLSLDMPIRKQVRSFGARYLIRNALVILAYGIITFVLWCLLPTFHTWILAALLFSAVISLIAIEQYGFRTFHCPECKVLLPKLDIWDGEDQITCFVCENCDIEWDTELRIPHD